MNNLPTATLLLWIASLCGHWFLPGFRQDLFQFPLAVILSISLPVSFWQTANRERGKYLSLLFAGIFIINVSFLLFIIWSNHSSQQALAGELNRGIRPQFAEYLETAVSGGKRELAAQIIYQRHGVALPYKNDTNSYTLYVPSESDKKRHRANFLSMNDLKLRSMDVASSFLTAVVLLVTHITLFIALLVFLVLYDKKDPEASTPHSSTDRTPC
jgi:hypothetical protein